jgi:hypothetical protein
MPETVVLLTAEMPATAVTAVAQAQAAQVVLRVVPTAEPQVLQVPMVAPQALQRVALQRVVLQHPTAEPAELAEL